MEASLQNRWQAELAEVAESVRAVSRRDQFVLPEGRGYFLGNSLGPLPRASEVAVQQAVQTWGRKAIGGWMAEPASWFTMVERMTPGMAELVGALPSEVTLTGSLTTNLHQVLATFLGDRPRPRIVTDALSFPSDRAALASFITSRGGAVEEQLRLIPSADGLTLQLEDIIRALAEPADLLWLPSVIYTSGQLLDLAAITAAARDRGIFVGWDLAHSVGIVEHALHGIGADAAVWCTYKYLNGGPGSVGGLFVHERHAEREVGQAGWFGARPAERFGAVAGEPRKGEAGRFQQGTPAVLTLASLEAALTLWADLDLPAVRTASLALTAFFRRLVEAELSLLGYSIVTPAADGGRGGHLAIHHREAKWISQQLREEGWHLDYRDPGLLRVAPSPLFNLPSELLGLVAALARFAGEAQRASPEARADLVP